MRPRWSDFGTILSLAVLLGCGGTEQNGSAMPAASLNMPSVELVSAAEAGARVAAGTAVLVDVREAAEIAAGMAGPAVWMPASRAGGDEWKRFVAAIPKGRQVIFYCAVGARSQQAALRLAMQGYRTANMRSFDAWVQAGLPVKTPVHPEIGK